MSTKVSCPGSFSQERLVNIEKLAVGGKMIILRHAACDCNTGCRRVTLWHKRPQGIEITDDFIVKAIAKVRWGDGCGGPEVEVDFKHGVILDLTGCYTEVELNIIEISGTAPDEDMLFHYGAMSACCGAGAARGCATRTTAITTVDGGGGAVTIPVPPFAYAVTFASAAPTDLLAVTTSFLQVGSGLGGIQALTFGNALPDPWMLVNGAETLVVGNDAVGDITFEAIFLIGV